MQGLLASGTYTALKLDNFGVGGFELQALITCSLAIISDLRLSKRADPAAAAEWLLNISGGDIVRIKRKYNPVDWVGALSTVILIISNQLPRADDDSPALASRHVTVQTKASFLGKEDIELYAKLEPELPGILLWALEGLRRLRKNKRFTEPKDAVEIRARMEAANSPVQAFIQQYCIYNIDAMVSKAVLYDKFCQMQRQNDQLVMHEARFAEAIYTAGAGRIYHSKSRLGKENKLVPVFKGIRLRTPADDNVQGALDI